MQPSKMLNLFCNIGQGFGGVYRTESRKNLDSVLYGDPVRIQT